MRITKNQLIDVAIQSVRQKNSLSMFWDYVKAAKEAGILSMDDSRVKRLLDDYQHIIYGKGFQYQEQDDKLPTTVSTHGLSDSSYRSRVIDGDPLDNIKSKAIDIAPLRETIPGYVDVMQPRPTKVYLIDRLTFWPLFKVVGVHLAHGTREVKQLYLVGLDRHTKQPFALGIPNGFVSMPMDACLRWTLDAHKGDKVIEV